MPEATSIPITEVTDVRVVHTIKPSVGRIVLFYNQAGAPVRPAIIVHVWSDCCINVGTWNGDGVPTSPPTTSIRLVQPGEDIPISGPYCTWMDYQIGQAESNAVQAQINRATVDSLKGKLEEMRKQYLSSVDKAQTKASRS
jgi:hypothetical protein